MASNNKKVTSSDYDFDDEDEVSSFSRILDKTKIASRNLGQTSDKPKTEPRTNVGQTSDELRTDSNLVVSSQKQTSDKPKTEPRTQPRTNVGQTSDELRTITGFQALSGLQKEIVLLMYEICLQKGDRNTGPVSVEHLSLRTNSTRLSIQKSVQRLEQKQIVIRRQSRAGRGGWTVYELPESIWNQILQAETSDKLRTNLGQISDKPKTEPKTEPRTSLSSSSRDLYSKESSTAQMAQVSNELSSLDVSNLREYGITLETFKRAVQLHPGVTIEALSDLAFRLSELFKQPKERAKIQNARGFVIKLVEQLAGGVTPLDHIETPDERLMREYAQAAAKKRADQQGYEESLLQAAFEKWDQETELDSKFEAVPLAQRAPAGSPRSAIFKEYFREKLWPETREAILKGEA